MALRLTPNFSHTFLHVGPVKKSIDFRQRCDKHGMYYSVFGQVEPTGLISWLDQRDPFDHYK